MKIKETSNDIWPELDDTHQTPLLDQTHQLSNSSVTIDMNDSTDLTSSMTNDELNQTTYFDTEQQQQQPSTS